MKKLLMALVGLACAAGLAAQTTSTVEGTIRDPEGKAVQGAVVTIAGGGFERAATSDAAGLYRILAVPPGLYSMSAAREGYGPVTVTDLQVDLNRTLVLDLGLSAGSVQQAVTVTGEAPMLDRTDTGTGGVVTPAQIESLPVNNRDYLALLQLIPGVTINRAADEGSDEALPVLGERAGNAIYLVDGMPNRSEFGGGPATQFNQDSIFEFEVITDGYKAEFGHGSGGVINVVTKSGQNDWRAAAVGFWRDDSLDTSNSLDSDQDTPALDRLDIALNAGGPLVRDRAYVFASAETIEEDRELNFSFPPATPQSVRNFETGFDQPTDDEQTRLFARFDEQIGASHRLTQSASYTEQDLQDFLPLSLATNLPSTRRSFDRERTMFGLRDTSLFGDSSSPWVFDGFVQYRDDSDVDRPAHPEAGPLTAFNIFSSASTFQFFGDLGTVNFGSTTTDTEIDQEYSAAGATMARTFDRHDVKGGLDFLRTQVDGHEFSVVQNQLFATEENFNRYGPIYAGFFSVTTAGGLTPDAAQIRLRNNYAGVFLQDDWRVTDELVVNFGLRWDRDSEFDDDDNFGPRVGIAWAPTEKTVVRASAGIYYDRFRLGLVRDVPDFGGADLRLVQPFSYPQLFHNVTTAIPVVFGLCISPVLTDAQIAATGAPCPFGPLPHYGRDHLSNLVAAGRNPIAPDTVVTIDNVQQLTGLTPAEYLARVSASVPLGAGREWFWGPFGALSQTGLPASQFPVTVDPSFETPHTEAYHVGIEHQLSRDWLIGADLHHRDMKDLLGVRVTNLAFVSRIPGNELTFDGQFDTFVNGFGPWYEGEFDAATVSVEKRMRNRWSFSAHYTYTDAEDNAQIAQLGDARLAGPGAPGYPSDSFIGTPPVVFDPTTGQSNENGSFTAGNGNPVPQAGRFYNGPDLDLGTSSLALENTFVAFGQVRLPLNFELAAIFRYQSGFPFSRDVEQSVALDIDGNGNFNTRDYDFERNSFEAPEFTTLDARAAWHFDVGRVAGTILLEFFNLTNEQNPAAVEEVPGRVVDFGQPLQVLPGREGQLGVRFEFGGGGR